LGIEVEAVIASEGTRLKAIGELSLREKVGSRFLL